MSGILIFEKNTFFRKVLVRILQGRFPYAVIKWVLNSEDCLVETFDFTPDIFLLGVNAYSGEDLDLVDSIRLKYPYVTIILLVDYDIDEYRKSAILRGVNHIIPKEMWTGQEILALVNTILAAKNSLGTVSEDSSYISGDSDFLKKPIERRDKGRRGRAREQEYLGGNPDRRLNGYI